MTSAAEKPLLMVDIDGVISLFGAPAGAGSWSGERRGGADSAPARGSFHSIDGMPHFLSSTAAAHLLELTRTSTWCGRAAGRSAPRSTCRACSGCPRGCPSCASSARRGRSNAHWKLAAIDAYAGLRPLAWIDDAFNDACHEWAAERPAPTLLVRTEPRDGLTTREARLLAAWARERSAA